MSYGDLYEDVLRFTAAAIAEDLPCADNWVEYGRSWNRFTMTDQEAHDRITVLKAAYWNETERGAE